VYFYLLLSPKGARGRAATPELLLEHQLKMPGSIRVSGSSITYFLHSIFSDFVLKASRHYYQPWRGTSSSICHLVFCRGRLGSPVVYIIARCCFLVAHPARTGCFTSEDRNSCVMHGQVMSSSVTEEEAQAVWHQQWRFFCSREIYILVARRFVCISFWGPLREKLFEIFVCLFYEMTVSFSKPSFSINVSDNILLMVFPWRKP
jgi:hypothetical protein